MPFTNVDTCVAFSPVNFDSPKSAILAISGLLVSKILLLFTSRCMIPGVHPVCRYSKPVE